MKGIGKIFKDTGWRITFYTVFLMLSACIQLKKTDISNSEGIVLTGEIRGYFNESFTGRFSIVVDRNSSLNLAIYTPFGSSILFITVAGGNGILLLPEEKRCILFREQDIQKVLPLNLSMSDIISIFFLKKDVNNIDSIKIEYSKFRNFGEFYYPETIKVRDQNGSINLFIRNAGTGKVNLTTKIPEDFSIEVLR